MSLIHDIAGQVKGCDGYSQPTSMPCRMTLVPRIDRMSDSRCKSDSLICRVLSPTARLSTLKTKAADQCWPQN